MIQLGNSIYLIFLHFIVSYYSFPILQLKFHLLQLQFHLLFHVLQLQFHLLQLFELFQFLSQFFHLKFDLNE